MKRKILKVITVLIILALMLGIGYCITPFSYVKQVTSNNSLFLEGEVHKSDKPDFNSKNDEIAKQTFELLNVWRSKNGQKTLVWDSNCLYNAKNILGGTNLKTFEIIKKGGRHYGEGYYIKKDLYCNAFQIANAILTDKRITEQLNGSKNLAVGICAEPNIEFIGYYKYCLVLVEYA